MSSGDMRVLVFDGPRRSHIETRSLPEPGPDEVRLRVTHAGICGSDLHGYTGESGRRIAGMIMGHEASGTVDRVGPDVVGLRVGDSVTFKPTLPCDGACGHIAENRCERLRLVGVTPSVPGALADAVLVPANRIVPLGALSLEWGASVEPMAVGLHAARRANVIAGDTVLVMGGGMVGLAAAQASRMEGASFVTVVDPLAERRGIATRSGFNATTPESLPGGELYDCVIDAVGIPATVVASTRAVKVGGMVSLVGLGLPTVKLILSDFVGSERIIAGSSDYSDAEFDETLQALSEGRLSLDFVTRLMVGFDELPAALEEMANGSLHELKVMLSTS